jgi:hypothetical protein
MLQIGANILIPELPNTANSYNQHSPATACLRSEWPGIVLPSPKNISSVESTFSIALCNWVPLSNRQDSRQSKRYCTPNSTLLRCLKATEESCELYDDVFEMESKTVGAACAVLPPLSACLSPRWQWYVNCREKLEQCSSINCWQWWCSEMLLYHILGMSVATLQICQ